MHVTTVCMWVTVSYVQKLATVLPILFLFVGVWLARRNRYPLLVLAFPIVMNTAAVASALYLIARGMSMSGGGQHAAAAGVAEAMLSWVIAGGAATLLALLFALLYPKDRQLDGRDESVSWLYLGLVGFFAGAMLWLSDELTSPAVQFPRLRFCVQATVWLAAIYAATGIAVMISGFKKSPTLVPPRGSFLILAIASGSFTYAMYTVIRVYHSMVISGWFTQQP